MLEMTAATIIRKYRKENNLTQQQFAELAGVSLRTVESAESQNKCGDKSLNRMLNVTGHQIVKKIESIKPA